MPIFDYDDRANSHAHLSFPNELAVLHNRAVRFMLNCSFGSHHCEMLSSLNWRPLLQGRELNGFKMVHCKFIGVLRSSSASSSKWRVRAGWQRRAWTFTSRMQEERYLCLVISVNHWLLYKSFTNVRVIWPCWIPLLIVKSC